MGFSFTHTHTQKRRRRGRPGPTRQVLFFVDVYFLENFGVKEVTEFFSSEVPKISSIGSFIICVVPSRPVWSFIELFFLLFLLFFFPISVWVGAAEENPKSARSEKRNRRVRREPTRQVLFVFFFCFRPFFSFVSFFFTTATRTHTPYARTPSRYWPLGVGISVPNRRLAGGAVIPAPRVDSDWSPPRCHGTRCRPRSSRVTFLPLGVGISVPNRRLAGGAVIPAPRVDSDWSPPRCHGNRCRPRSSRVAFGL